MTRQTMPITNAGHWQYLYLPCGAVQYTEVLARCEDDLSYDRHTEKQAFMTQFILESMQITLCEEACELLKDEFSCTLQGDFEI